MTGLHRAIACPCFAEDPEELIELGVSAEKTGFDGFFIWDHIVFANEGDGPPIIDPWLVLAVVAARTSVIKIGTMVTPVSRRRPWVLARQTASLDVLSRGRLILGVGLGSPPHGDFGIFRRRHPTTSSARNCSTRVWMSSTAFGPASYSSTPDGTSTSNASGSAPHLCSSLGYRYGSAACCPPSGPCSGRRDGTARYPSDSPTGR